MKAKPIFIYCQACRVAYASVGERPSMCPACDSMHPEWTTTPPYRLTVNDRRFLKQNRIAST